MRSAQPQCKVRKEEYLAMLNQKVIISFHNPCHILRYLNNFAVLLVVLNVAQAVWFQMWLGKPLLGR